MPTPQDKLVELLSRVPLTTKFDGRTQLLDGVAGCKAFTRDESNLLKDLQLIIRRIRTDRVALRRLVDNVRSYLADHEVSELEGIVQEVWSRPPVPALELGVPHRFDLDTLVEECVPKIRKHTGLLGFTLSSPCDRLIDNLCERVKDAMSTFGGAHRRQLNAITGITSKDKAINQLQKLLTITAHDIVCSAVVSDDAAASEMWTVAKNQSGSVRQQRFVLFMLLKEDCTSPAGMLALQPPVFRLHHAESWWREVLHVRMWGRERLMDILHCFVRPSDERAGDDLDIDGVYDGLADAIELLKIHTDEEQFHAAWSRRLQGAT